MGEIYTRVYTYTGQSSWVSGSREVPLSAFTISGDTKPITEVLSVSLSYYRWHRTSSTVSHTSELIFANGSASITSNSSSYRGDEEVFKVTNEFVAMPSASDFTEANTIVRTYPSTKTDSVYWQATSSRPMILTVTYYSSAFKPSMTSPNLYRSDANGIPMDTGTNLSLTVKLGVEDVGTNGSGLLQVYGDYGLICEVDSISGSTSGVVVEIFPLPNHTLGIDDDGYYRVVYSYTAAIDTGSVSTETVEYKFHISSTFVNVHLSGKTTGGVAFGKYSSSEEGNPTFECEYPAYFKKLGSGWTYLTPLAGTTPAEYGGGVLRCRAIEDKRIIAGSVQVKPSSGLLLAKLPDGYTPSHNELSMNACSGSRIARICVYGENGINPGYLAISWVRDLSDGDEYTSASIWIQCSMEYWVEPSDKNVLRCGEDVLCGDETICGGA